jgi:hypothetical protein
MSRPSFAATVLALSLSLPICSQTSGEDVVEARFGTTVVLSTGLQGRIFYISRYSKKLPNLDKKKPVGTIYTPGLNIPPRQFTEGFPGITNRNEWFALDYTGRFWIDKPGKYHFAIESDDGSKLYIDDKEVIDNDGLHPPQRKQAEIDLAGGIHSLRLSYFQGPRFEIALILSVEAPGDTGYRIFSTNEFKPPSDPADWKFGKPDDLKNLPDLTPARKRKRLQQP